MAKTATTQPEIIEVMDDSDHEGIPPSASFRVLGDGCLELLDDSENETNHHISRSPARKRRKKHPTAPSRHSIPDGGCVELLDDSGNDDVDSELCATAVATATAKPSARRAQREEISDKRRTNIKGRNNNSSKSKGDTSGIIGLLSDSDDSDNDFLHEPRIFAKPPATMNQNSSSSSSSSSSQDLHQPPTVTPSPKKKLKTEAGSSIGRAEMEDALVVPPTLPTFCPAVTVAPAAAATATNANDDDIELMGHTGHNALSDFPHSREHCVQKLFSVDPHQFCPNCFCFVCDIPASNCSSWQQHCRATYSSPHWNKERKKKKENQRTAVPQQPPNRIGAAVATASGEAPRATVPSWRLKLSVKKMLDAVTRMYPSERSPPESSGFRTKLRHYQKQSLSFMLDVEESQEGWTHDVTYQYFNQYLTEPFHTRGGWLCSEVGMGKTAVVIALVASRPAAYAISKTESRGPKRRGRKRLKATVVMTSVSLMGQWEDECRKHAPSLNVVRFHPSNSKATRYQIETADIVITSATYKKDRWSVCGINLDNVMFHRVVQDESHLFHSRTVSARPASAQRVPATNRWCCTATPITSTASALEKQMTFLGMPYDLRSRMYTDVELLKKHMIRHVKSQKINGATALALPKSTSSVLTVTMTQSERSAYDKCMDINRYRLQQMKTGAAKFFHVKNQIVYELSRPHIMAHSSKIMALEKSIVDLMKKDPNMRVVVFTQMRQVLQHVELMVKNLSRRTPGGIDLYSFNGASSHKKRDESIRSFQSTASKGPAVFAITLNAGSVGITLTAASHVFLMEPSIDPAEEVQAAGRINRLGQTKSVTVTKLVYKDTYESHVVELHEKIASGEITFTADGIPRAAVCILLKDV